ACGGRAIVHPVGRLNKTAGAGTGICGSATHAGKKPARRRHRRARLCSTPRTDLNCPLLIVYTSGTTGRPKGAVLRQEALLWNGVMSQHMHGLTSEDHVLTVLPFFHVGGLNIQTTPALQFGATVTIHP